MQIENGRNHLSRKKFVVWTAGILSAVTALNFFTRSTPQKKTKTIKFLTSDGKLVEVEISKLPPERKKIKDDDIHTWIKRKPSL